LRFFGYGLVLSDPQRITGEEWISLFAEAMNKKDEYSVLPGWLVKGLGLFIPIMKEIADMNYQYDRDYYFDSAKFNDYFKFEPTSNAEAVKLAVEQIRKLEK